MSTETKEISTYKPTGQMGDYLKLYESLLPFRILAHATLALFFLPLVVAYITINFSPIDLTSLMAFVIFGILGFMCGIDYAGLHRFG